MPGELVFRLVKLHEDSRVGREFSDPVHAVEGFHVGINEADIGENENVGGAFDAGLFQRGRADGHSAHEMDIGLGLDRDEVGDHHGRAFGRLRVAVEDLDHFIGEGGVFANHYVVPALERRVAEAGAVDETVE